MYFMHEVGFEPTKLMQQILSLSPLTTRESVLRRENVFAFLYFSCFFNVYEFLLK